MPPEKAPARAAAAAKAKAKAEATKAKKANKANAKNANGPPPAETQSGCTGLPTRACTPKPPRAASGVSAA